MSVIALKAGRFRCCLSRPPSAGSIPHSFPSLAPFVVGRSDSPEPEIEPGDVPIIDREPVSRLPFDVKLVGIKIGIYGLAIEVHRANLFQRIEICVIRKIEE